MNERFKELWEKAEVWDSSDDGRGGLKILLSVEKFAELIVRECVDIIDKDAELPDDIGGNAYLRMASKKIKQHFGVEE